MCNRDAPPSPAKAVSQHRETPTAPAKDVSQQLEAAAAPAENANQNREAAAAPAKNANQRREAVAAPAKNANQQREAAATPAKSASQQREAAAAAKDVSQQPKANASQQREASARAKGLRQRPEAATAVQLKDACKPKPAASLAKDTRKNKEKAVLKTQAKPRTNKKKGKSGKLRDEDIIGKTMDDFSPEQLQGMTDAQFALLAPVQTELKRRFRCGQPLLLPEDLETAGKTCREFHAKCMEIMKTGETTLNMSYENEHFFNGPGDNNIDMEDIFYLLNLEVIESAVMRCFVLYVLQTQSNFSLDSLKR